MKKDNSGFSLIELIIVIAIMAVMIAMIAPNLTKYLGTSKRSTDTHNASELADMIQICIMDYEVDYGNFISGASNVSLSWTGRNVSGGPVQFNTMLDTMVAEEPVSEETGAIASAVVSLKGASPMDGYKVAVTLGNVTVTK